MRTVFVAMILAFMPIFSVYGQDADQLAQLARIKLHIETVEQLHQEGGLNEAQTAAQTSKYLTQAAKILKKEDLSRDELFTLTKDVELEAPGALSKLAGYITLVNIVWLTAAILMAIAIGWLVMLYVVPFVAELSDVAIQFVAYSTTLTIVGASQSLPDIAVVPSAFVGCLLMIGCLALTENFHFSRASNAQTRMTLYCSLLFIAWSAAAVYYSSTLLGFIAVAAFVSALGFSIIVTPLCYFIGFKDDEAIVRGTLAGGTMVGIYTLIATTGIVVPTYLEIFRTGVMWIGTFVYFIGLLIMASKYYSKDFQYLFMQALMIASGVLAIGVGSLYEIATLQRIGGTLFYLYVIEKYFEIPWGKGSWAWVTLLFSGLLYAGAWFASANPAYFLF